MKYVLLLFVVIAACSASVLRGPIQGYKEGDRHSYSPKDDDGTPHLIDAEETEDLAFIEENTRNPDNNAYFLYTRLNPSVGQVLVHNSIGSVLISNLNPSKNIVFLAHGWGGNGRDNMNTMLIDAFLQDDDVNVIVLDWRARAGRTYARAKSGTAAVGRGLGQFVNWLVGTLRLSYKQIHLVGFCLGGHLVGNAGRETESNVARITALDPAGPLWSLDSDRLSSSDAQYVEVIHTEKTVNGYYGRLGHADFYPNGGSNMPGCITLGCSQSRSIAYMASSIKYNHLLANECSNLTQATTTNRCRGSLYPMGNSDVNKSGEGIFRVNTGRNYPY